MAVIDTHTHAWGPSTDDHPWVNEALVDLVDGLPVEDVYTADRLLADMDDAAVDEAVLVGFPIDDWRDHRYTVAAVREHDRLSGVVTFDVFADDAGRRLEAVMAVDGIVGIRLGAVFPYDRMWVREDPSTDWLRTAIDETGFWRAAAETGAAVHLLVRHDQLDQVRELVETHPEVTYLVDHMARVTPDLAPEEAFAELRPVAGTDTVVKLSAAPALSEASFPYADLHDHVRWLVDVFGRDSLAWGSDYPFVSDVADYDRARRWIEHVPELSAADRSWLTERTFRRRVLDR